MDPHTQQLWLISLGVAVVVVIVVAILLELIVRNAAAIHRLTEEIWIGGKRIAGNTVQIALLSRTNDLAGVILGSASEIAKVSAQLRQHLGGSR